MYDTVVCTVLHAPFVPDLFSTCGWPDRSNRFVDWTVPAFCTCRQASARRIRKSIRFCPWLSTASSRVDCCTLIGCIWNVETAVLAFVTLVRTTCNIAVYRSIARFIDDNREGSGSSSGAQASPRYRCNSERRRRVRKKVDST